MRQSRKKTGKPATEKRQYDSPLRRQQAAETRERIVAAGAEIAHRLPAWDWRELTYKAVGERAGISERTVHRYFSSERMLRDAILQQLVIESGVQLDTLELGDFAGIAASVYRYLSSFAAQETVMEPSFAALDQQRREVLLSAVARATPRGWSAEEQEMAAAMLDILWNPVAYERLNTVWRLDTGRATRAIAWTIGLVQKAIENGPPPGAGGEAPAAPGGRKRSSTPPVHGE